MLTCCDTTWAKVSSGNLNLYMTAGCGYEELAAQGRKLADEMMTQMSNKVIDQPRLRELLPVMELRLTSGADNPVANMLRFRGITFNDFAFDMRTSPQEGINGDMRVYSLMADSMRIDTIRMHIRQENPTSVSAVSSRTIGKIHSLSSRRSCQEHSSNEERRSICAIMTATTASAC